MNQQWKDFLTTKGANIDQFGTVDFGDQNKEISAAMQNDVIVDLSHLGMISAEGDDVQTFLQGQFSNDVKLVDTHISQLSSYNSPKGRVLALFRLLKRDSSYYLLIPAELIDATLKRLRMFVMRSKVKLDNVSTNFVRIGVSGPGVADKLRSELGTEIPESENAVATANGITIIRVSGKLPRFIVFGEVASMQTLWQTLSSSAQTVGRAAWAWLDIDAGIPSIHNETVEEFVPQMVNLQLIGGVSFTKGCYPGQEIVARMHYLGQLKKRMYRIHVEANNLPQPGANIYESTTGNEQSIGQIVDAQPSPNGGYDALAVLQIQAAEQRDLHLENRTGPKVELKTLPYAFPQ